MIHYFLFLTDILSKLFSICKYKVLQTFVMYQNLSINSNKYYNQPFISVEIKQFVIHKYNLINISSLSWNKIMDNNYVDSLLRKAIH